MNQPQWGLADGVQGKLVNQVRWAVERSSIVTEAGVIQERAGGRSPSELRPIKFTRQYSRYAPGSVMVEVGETKVLVTATIEERTPRHVEDKHGWLTAEYSMLPGSTHTRNARERMRVSGRTMEIQRLIGRSLRTCIDLSQTGERTFTIDADVIQADGGTRTASITGGYVALFDALTSLRNEGLLDIIPIRFPVAAVSLGVVNNTVMLDLDYSEDSAADVDANLVMNNLGQLIEFQLTSEQAPLDRHQVDSLLEVGRQGIQSLMEAMQAAMAEPLTPTSAS